MTRSSQTMRIDIPPSMKEELRAPGKKRGLTPPPEPVPQIPDTSPSNQALGNLDFQELFQSVYDGAIITNLDGTIVDANPRALAFLHYTQGELTGLNLTHIVSGATPETISTLKAGVSNDRFVLMQAYCARKDQSIFPSEIAVNLLTIRGGKYFCCFVRDITVRQEAEEMLHTIRTAVQNAATGIVISDLNGQIDYINQAGARLWGESKPESITGSNLKQLIPGEDTVTAILATVQRGESWSGELILSRKDSTTIHVQLTTAPNRNADEELIGMVMSFLDISDRIRAQDAEQQAERQRVMVESLGAACHHLGQPATVLLASLELLARIGPSDKDMSGELLKSSIDAAESLRTMLHNLNDITEYRTTPYIESQNTVGVKESRILDVLLPFEDTILTR